MCITMCIVDELNFEWSLSIKVINYSYLCTVIGQWLFFMIIFKLILCLAKLHLVQGVYSLYIGTTRHNYSSNQIFHKISFSLGFRAFNNLRQKKFVWRQRFVTNKCYKNRLLCLKIASKHASEIFKLFKSTMKLERPFVSLWQRIIKKRLWLLIKYHLPKKNQFIWSFLSVFFTLKWMII